MFLPPVDTPLVVRAEPLLRVDGVEIKLLKGIGSIGECITVELKLNSDLEEVGYVSLIKGYEFLQSVI